MEIFRADKITKGMKIQYEKGAVIREVVSIEPQGQLMIHITVKSFFTPNKFNILKVRYDESFITH